MYYTYVLKSIKDNTTYIGSTGDLVKRLKDHNAGKTRSIRHKIPVELVYYEAYESKSLALKREIELKRNSFKKKELFDRIF